MRTQKAKPTHEGAEQISIRVAVADLRRAEVLQPKIARERTLGNVSRSEVLRLALVRGLEALEREYK